MGTDRLVNMLHFVGAMILLRIGSIFNDVLSSIGGWVVLIGGFAVMYKIRKDKKKEVNDGNRKSKQGGGGAA